MLTKNITKVKMTKRRKTGDLSHRESSRLGGLIKVLANAKPLEEVVTNLQDLNMVIKKDDCLMLTSKGLDETRRLSTLAGLNTQKRKDK